MTRKTGVPTMLEEARSLQGHLSTYGAELQGIYPSNPGIASAVADCAACLVNLIQELAAVREKGD